MKRNSGQSVAEYCMIGALVLVVSLGGLVLLGGNVSELFGGMLNFSGQENQTAQVTASAQNQGPVAPQSEVSPVLPTAPSPVASTLPPQGKVSIKLSNGSTVYLNMPTDIKESVQTIGANGTMVLLGSSLESMAKQMLAAGEINQVQANTILKLANQAHQMAAIHKELEDVSNSFGDDVAAFKNTPVTINGKQYASGYQASLSIGIDEDQQGAQGEELTRFWALYKDATGATYQWPPELKEVLSYHARHVHELSDSLRVAMRDVIVYNNGVPSDLHDLVISRSTDIEAGSICTLGGNTDSGIQCSE